jgi:hypothetical protein
MAALKLRPPRLLPTGDGYRYEGQSIVGFADRADIPAEARLVIARLARRYAHDGPSAAQLVVLEAFDERHARPVASDYLHALREDEDLLVDGYQNGLYAELGERPLQLASDPSRHPGLHGRSYPLSIGEAALLTGASLRQLRTWDEAGLLQLPRVGNRRMFLRAGVLKAMLLSRTPKPVIAAACAVARGNDDGQLLLRLIGAYFIDRSGANREQEGIDAGRYLVEVGRRRNAAT